MLGTLDAGQIEQVLHAEVIGRIGCHADGRTYVVPVTYAYEGGCVYAHSAAGLKVQMMRLNPEVCFEVDHMDNLANWRSVIAWGRFEELAAAEAQTGMGILIRRVMPLLTSETATPTHGVDPGPHRVDTAGHVPVIFRIRLGEKTGRYERR